MTDDDVRSRRGDRIAYLTVRFPSLSETFVAREIAQLRALGWQLEIDPLRGSSAATVHDDVRPLLDLVHWRHPLAPGSLGAALRSIRSHPRAVLAVLAILLREALRQPGRAGEALLALPIALRLADELPRRGVRHLHAHFASHPTFVALVVSRLTDISYSFTGHAYDLYVRPLLLSEKARGARFAVAISAYNQRLLEPAAGGATPVHVVHCGVDVPARLPAVAAGGPPRLLCVARLEEKKGLPILIEACRILRERGLELSCTIVGGGPLERALRDQISRAGLDEMVTLTGPLTSDAVRTHLASATVFALPSVVTPDGNADGIPVALMEAMAAGVPVVSTRTTGIPELIEDGVNGLLVDQRDASALASALAWLLDHPDERDRLRRAAFESVGAEFNLADTGIAMSRLFECAGLRRACTAPGVRDHA